MVIDADSQLPLYLQVAAELRREIAEGEVTPGGRLPPARDMAAVRGSTTTRCSALFATYAMKVFLSSNGDAASLWSEMPQS